MKRIFSISILFLFCTASAQDIHWSQFYAAPLSLNPAKCGAFDGDVRAGLNYRSQWSAVPVPFKTMTAWADAPLKSQKFRFYPAIGFSALHDQAGDGNLRSDRFSALLGLHKRVGVFNSIVYHAGLQATYVQRKIDYSKLYFNSQWNDYRYDPANLPSGENPTAVSHQYFDVSFGMSMNVNRFNGSAYYFSAALHHLAQPVESFYGTSNRIGIRPVIETGATFHLSEFFNFSPAMMYTSEKRASEFVIGSNLTLLTQTMDERKFLAGIWMRAGDAVVFDIGAETYGVRGILSYDINTSSLKRATNGRGALELSLVWIGLWKNRHVLNMMCPRF